MQIKYEARFEKDLKKIQDKKLFQRIKECINLIKLAENLYEITQSKKMKGHDSFYRIKLGDYRIGFEFLNDNVILTRILHRKDIYRYFP